jgi:hypothetical protein
VKDIYNENYNTLIKANEEDTKNWKDTPCSWIGIINIIKMSLLPKIVKEISKKIPMALFTK